MHAQKVVLPQPKLCDSGIRLQFSCIPLRCNSVLEGVKRSEAEVKGRCNDIAQSVIARGLDRVWRSAQEPDLQHNNVIIIRKLVFIVRTWRIVDAKRLLL